MAENTATVANLAEALGQLALACGAGEPAWRTYRNTASRHGDKVVIVIEPVKDDGWKPAD